MRVQGHLSCGARASSVSRKCLGLCFRHKGDVVTWFLRCLHSRHYGFPVRFWFCFMCELVSAVIEASILRPIDFQTPSDSVQTPSKVTRGETVKTLSFPYFGGFEMSRSGRKQQTPSERSGLAQALAPTTFHTHFRDQHWRVQNRPERSRNKFWKFRSQRCMWILGITTTLVTGWVNNSPQIFLRFYF